MRSAFQLRLQAGGDAVHRAIETVGRAGDSALGGLVADHLENYPPAESAALLSRLYLALGRHQDAAAAAMHAAYNDQKAGNYKVGRRNGPQHACPVVHCPFIFPGLRVTSDFTASRFCNRSDPAAMFCKHNMKRADLVSGGEVLTSLCLLCGSQLAHETLVAAWRAKEGVDTKLLQELREKLVLLHSYILIKPLVRLGDHEVPFSRIPTPFYLIFQRTRAASK